MRLHLRVDARIDKVGILNVVGYVCADADAPVEVGRVVARLATASRLCVIF